MFRVVSEEDIEETTKRSDTSDNDDTRHNAASLWL